MPTTDEREAADKESALTEVALKAQTDSLPKIDSDDLDEIITRNQVAVYWAAGRVISPEMVTRNYYLLPFTDNGRRYKILTPGTLGDTENFASLILPQNRYVETATNGDVTLEDGGASFTNIYDIKTAIVEAWELKAANASRFMSTGGVNMARLYDNCMKMAERFSNVPLLG